MSEKPVCPFCQRPVTLDGDTLRCEYENCPSRYCGLCNKPWSEHPRIGCSARMIPLFTRLDNPEEK